MNIKRGFIRLWIACSILWIGAAEGIGWSSIVADVGTLKKFYGVEIAPPTGKELVGPYPVPDKVMDWKNSPRSIGIDDNFDDGERALLASIARVQRKLARAGLVSSFRVLAGPLALGWLALFAGFWIASGFKGKQ